MQMKNRMKLSVVLALVLGGTVAVFAQQQTFTGTLTDSMCGATHMAKDKTPAECTRMCVKDGMKYALATDKKLYGLEGHEPELAKLAGQKATVRGSLKGEALTVESVTPIAHKFYLGPSDSGAGFIHNPAPDSAVFLLLGLPTGARRWLGCVGNTEFSRRLVKRLLRLRQSSRAEEKKERETGQNCRRRKQAREQVS
jgi:hypothetical protein